MMNVKEIRYFHPKGLYMPNGCIYQRGGFLNECRINKDNFELEEGLFNAQKDKGFGGIIVFPADLNTMDTDVKLNGILKKEKVSAYSFGNHFKGNFIDNNGNTYNCKSLSLEIAGVSTRKLLSFAKILTKEHLHHTLLVKDLNTNKIFNIRIKYKTPS